MEGRSKVVTLVGEVGEGRSQASWAVYQHGMAVPFFWNSGKRCKS